jgi:hypothetical protein
MFLSEDTITQAGFSSSSYKIIKFLRKLTNTEYRDIFRVSDGPDLWLGCCSKEKITLEQLGFPLVYATPTNRAHLDVLADVTKFLYLENQPIEFFTNFLIEVSEKELEAHFNQLYPAGEVGS